jgi:hypothetical protein
MDPVRELKVRAEILHRAVQGEDAAAIERLRALAELKRAGSDALRVAAREVQRKHCLAAVAREAGFASWEHALRVLDEEGPVGRGGEGEADFGTTLYGAQSGAHLNHWFASYDEAHAYHRQASTPSDPRYLLAYKRHFFVVDRHFIEGLGLDGSDRDWQAIGWDWARPASFAARRRLYAKVLARG